MSVAGILSSLLEQGVRLRAEGERLVVNAPAGVMTEEMAASIRAHKADILAALREIADAESSLALPQAPLPAAAGSVSLSQERIWTVSQLHPETLHYALSEAWWLRGPRHVSALEQALRALCDRHGLMRARFVPGDEGAVRLDTAECGVLTLERIDLSDESPEHVEAVAQVRMEALARVPFDLAAETLVRAYLLELDAQRALLYIVTHSIIWDAPSFEILIEELGTLYQNSVAGTSVTLPEIPIRFEDYAWWQRERHQAPAMLAALRYWKDQLAGTSLAPLPLPVDRVPERSATPLGARFHFTFPAALAAAVSTFCKTSGVTPFMLLLSAYVLLLSRYADRETVVITAAVQERNDARLERMIGTFTNHIFLPFQVNEDLSFTALVGMVKERTLDALAYQHCAVEAVIEALDVDLGQSSLFQLNYIYRSAEQQPRAWGPLEVLPGPSRNSNAIHGDLSFWIDEANDTLTAGIDYRADLFEEESIARLVRRFLHLLEQGLARPQEPVTRISLDQSDAWPHGQDADRSGQVISVLDAITALIKRLSLKDDDVILFADAERITECPHWEQAARPVGARLIRAPDVALGDERDLYQEVCRERPRVLLTSVPMATALCVLDLESARLGETTLVTYPAQASMPVLHRLAQSFQSVLPVLERESTRTPVLAGSLAPAGDALVLEPVPGLVVRVRDRLDRDCPPGIDGALVVWSLAPGAIGEWENLNARGRWIEEQRIRLSDWLEPLKESDRLARIETALSELPGIRDYHVERRRAQTGKARWLIWVQQDLGAERTTTELRAVLHETLVELPSPIAIVDVGVMPRRVDGVLIAELLDDPFADHHAAGFELPSPGPERVLAEIWSEILGVQRIGAHDSFAELGGTSLQAIRVIQRMEARLGWRVEPRLLFFQSLRRVAARAPKKAPALEQAA
ncbi:hypothetical protein CKO25_09320 [Thiocapsa imhoffii]|uniref:Carrier domain-containing protein n=1 Tax=Thiocapsa imhoffii TaxID=382777 RepID=A0A9X0WIE1_9GAMM|nr:condensation domain-containing protein [Thiocapsa imhoffii]MBK1644844.1 hypothetical protein [Thiocapsa imhoffii]